MSSQKVHIEDGFLQLPASEDRPKPRRSSLASAQARRVSVMEGVRFAFQQPAPPRPSNRRSISLWSDSSDQEFIERGLRAQEKDGMHEPDIKTQTKATKGGKTQSPGPDPPGPRSKIQIHYDKWKYHRRKGRYFTASRKVANYWRKVMLMFETIYEELRFPIMPEKTGTLNHLSGQLWLVTFLMKDLTDEIVNTADITKLNEMYARAVYEAVLTQEFVRAFEEPLRTMTDVGATRFNEMKLAIFGSEESSTSKALLEIDLDLDSSKKRLTNMINAELEGTSSGGDPGLTGGRKNSNTTKRPSFEIPKSIKDTLLRGSRIQRDLLFDHLEVYTRTTAKRKWYIFNGFTFERKLTIVTEALTAVTDSLIKMRRLLKPVNRFLKVGASKSCLPCHRRSVVKYLETMATSLHIISVLDKPQCPQFAEIMANEEPKMITVLRRTESYIQSIVSNGKQIVTQLMEVMALSELCYVYLVDGLRIPMKPCEEVVKRLYKNYQPKAVFSKKEFQAEDFFNTRYPDVLRKVPVIVHRTELSLHKCTEQSLTSIVATRQAGGGGAHAPAQDKKLHVSQSV